MTLVPAVAARNIKNAVGKMIKFFKSKISLAIFSAILLILIFPKYNLSFLAWVALVPLLISIEGENFSRSFRYGFFTGFIFYGGTIYWLIATLKIYGNISWPVSLIIGGLLMAYLALYFALFCGLASFFNRYFYSFNIFLLSFLWVGLEYLRTYFLSGFPWNLLGYSQWNNLPIAQISSITGVYGVSFLVVLVNVLIAKAISFHWQLTNRKQSLYSIEICVLILCITFGHGWLALAHRERVEKLKPINTAIIQPNIAPDVKWVASQKRRVMEQYHSFIERTKNDRLEIIVFPETALPGLLRYDSYLLRCTQRMARLSKAYLLVGSLDRQDSKFYTSCFCLNPAGEITGQYDKTHLVPFGEIFPFRKLLEKIIPVVRELGDFSPGENLKVIKTPQGNYGVNICYEDIFPDLVRRLTKDGAEILVNITIDSWYLDTSAPYQHFYMNVFRAIENRRWVVRSASTGISGYIDPFGNIVAQTKLFQPQIAIHGVIPQHKLTFYAKHGDIFAKASLYLVILSFLGGLIRRRVNA